MPASARASITRGSMEKTFCVYILTNKIYGTLYVGVTSNLPKRIWEHKNKSSRDFPKNTTWTSSFIMKFMKTQNPR